MLLLVGGAVALRAETTARRPEGIEAGRWIVGPSVETRIEGDDNVFRQEARTVCSFTRRPCVSDEECPTVPQGDAGCETAGGCTQVCEDQRVADILATLTAGIEAHLPLRNSMFDLAYEGRKLNYRETVLNRDVTHNFQGAFGFEFGTGDKLTLDEEFALDVSDVQRTDEGGERVFDGRPFRYNRWGIEMSRAEFRQPGYSVRVARRDLNFDRPPEQAPPFFEYRGFDASIEYRHPLAGEKWLVTSFDWRDYNHYNGRPCVYPYGCDLQGEPLPADNRCEAMQEGADTISETRDTEEPCFGRGSAIVDPVGEPFREEKANSIQLGLRGATGKSQPFLIIVGWGTLRYDSFDPFVRDSRYSGPVGQLRWDPAIGGRSRLELQFIRRPLPSNFNTYYVNNQLRGQFEWEWLRGSSVGVRGRFDRNRYGDPVVIAGCGEPNPRAGEKPDFDEPAQPSNLPFDRRDRSRFLSAFAEWTIRPGVGFGVEYERQVRDSNCPRVEFRANVLSANFVFGWF